VFINWIEALEWCEKNLFIATSAPIRCWRSMPPHFPSSTPPQQHRTGTAPNSDSPQEEPTDVRPHPNLQRRQRHESAGDAPSLDVPLWHHCASVTPSSPPGGPLALRRQLLSLPLRSWRRSCTNVSRNTHTVNPTGPAWWTYSMTLLFDLAFRKSWRLWTAIPAPIIRTPSSRSFSSARPMR